MKKQSGFTLIELMVVMAIIAILATAGLSAYTGYLKKARDATRISDLAALNTIVLAEMSSTWTVPIKGVSTAWSETGIHLAVKNANNGVQIYDPLQASPWATGKSSCYLNSSSGSASTSECAYFYSPCDTNTWYLLFARFESSSNQSLYNISAVASGTTTTTTTGLYSVGTGCATAPTASEATSRL